MIKNYLSLAVMTLLPVTFNAQDGKVGINTEKPTRTLDIKGDLRVRTIEDAQDFDGLLVPTNIYVSDPVTKQKKLSEKNVVKMASFKGDASFQANLASDIIGGNASESGQPGKITDNQWIYANFKATTPPKDPDSAYAEVSASYPSAIRITKFGFYQINATVFAEISEADTARVNFSSIDYAILTASLNATAKGNSFSLGNTSTTVFRGGKITKVGSFDAPYRYTDHGQKIYRLNIVTSGFFPKDTYIYLQLHTFGIPGVVDTYSNFKFLQDLTTIQITKNL